MLLCTVAGCLWAPVEIGILRDPRANVETRVSAAEALGERGDPRAVDALVVALKDPAEEVRRTAERALVKLGDRGAIAWAKQDPQAINRMIAALKDQDVGVRRSAVWALGALRGPQTVDPLIAALSDPAVSIRVEVCKALGGIEDPQVVDALSEALRDMGPGVPEVAWESLHGLGPMAVDRLVKHLRDQDASTRRRAMDVLVRFRGQATDGLVEMLRDEDPEVRHRAREVLQRLGPEAIEYKRKALKSRDAETRRKAAETLGEIGDPRALKPLTKALRDRDQSVREAAWRALVKLGEVSTEVLRREPGGVDRLIKALRDRDPMVRRGAVQTLGEIENERVREGVVQRLGDQNPRVREVAWKACVRYGPAVVDRLMEWMNDNQVSPEARVAAIHALGDIGDPRAVDPLVEALSAPRIRDTAWSALATIGPVAVERLMNALQDTRTEVRRAAAELLGKIGDSRARGVLEDRLEDVDRRVRLAALLSLRQFRCPPSVDQLEALLADSYRIMQLAASEMIVQRAPDRTVVRAHARAVQDSLVALVSKRTLEGTSHPLDKATRIGTSGLMDASVVEIYNDSGEVLVVCYDGRRGRFGFCVAPYEDRRLVLPNDRYRVMAWHEAGLDRPIYFVGTESFDSGEYLHIRDVQILYHVVHP